MVDFDKISAFKIKVGNQLLDYRLGGEVDLEDAIKFFEKKYKVEKIFSGGRHVLGYLQRGNKKLFLKLATSEGISAVTRTEYSWNFEFNKLVPRSKSKFWVPKNFDSGFYKNKLFYLITDRFEGDLIATTSKIKLNLKNNIDNIIEFSELIQNLKIKSLKRWDAISTSDFRKRFLLKVKTWLESLPADLVAACNIQDLLTIVENGVANLYERPRHGDFAPWHIFKLKSGLGLIDGEHAIAGSIENYDIGYFMQRTFSVLKNPQMAQIILDRLVVKKYEIKKLRLILAARAIGGFLDEYLAGQDYKFAVKFKDWAISIA